MTEVRHNRLCAVSIFNFKESTQKATQSLRRFPDYNLHNKTPFHHQNLQQAHPQPISRNATRNNSAPTGKMAEIRIPTPSATAKIPKIRFPPLPNTDVTPFPWYSIYTGCLSGNQKTAGHADGFLITFFGF